MPWLLVVGGQGQGSRLCVRDEGNCATESHNFKVFGCRIFKGLSCIIKIVKHWRCIFLPFTIDKAVIITLNTFLNINTH